MGLGFLIRSLTLKIRALTNPSPARLQHLVQQSAQAGCACTALARICRVSLQQLIGKVQRGQHGHS